MNQEQRHCWILAGPNGSGKSTFAARYLPRMCPGISFLNVDTIAAGLSAFNPSGAAVEAGRIMSARFREHVAAAKVFGFETTLSGRTYEKILTQMKADGWKLSLIYLWIPGPEASLKRVAQRVLEGGHDISLADIQRRHRRSLRNLLHVYTPLCDHVMCMDNRYEGGRPIYLKTSKMHLEVFNDLLYERLWSDAE